MPVVADKLNISDLARECRCHPNSIWRYQSEGCPIEDGAEAVKAWLAERGKAKQAAREETSDLKERKLLAECSKLEAEVVAKELANQIAAGEVANIEDENAELAERLIYAKAQLESMVDTIAKEAPQELRVRMRAIAKEATEMFYKVVANWKPGDSAE